MGIAIYNIYRCLVVLHCWQCQIIDSMVSLFQFGEQLEWETTRTNLFQDHVCKLLLAGCFITRLSYWIFSEIPCLMSLILVFETLLVFLIIIKILLELQVVALKEDGCPKVWVVTSDICQQHAAHGAVWSPHCLGITVLCLKFWWHGQRI